ncbi:C-C chemokine receptor type 6 [Phyllopteryx taeniolatus]|uniref:C-C chemokine receptor type 6 n=1 Tax=Phyllopteryx taeniolatus TaxID=161469 RepID=UPI002AD55EF5|nr:C-C chemokine receptor type 6 [Phyllopteryx taeniolatus]XP_061651011.1 C-C chemokine receptor type 6 [Phyllopteryx taeniolatus]
MTSAAPDYYNPGTADYTDVEVCNLDPDPAQVTIQTGTHAVICALGLIGNILVVVTYAFYKGTKTVTDVYLVNVAAADLSFVLALPFIIYNERHGWPTGSGVCKALSSAYSVNLYSGMLLLACVGGDRYVAIVRARRSFGARSGYLIYSRIVCSAVWACAAALTLPTLIYTERFEEAGLGAESARVMCQLSFSNDETAKFIKKLVPCLQMAVGFLLPLAAMALCYSSIARTLIRARSGRRHGAVRVVLAVVVVFIACHLPYNVALLNHTLDLFQQRGCQGERFNLRVLAISKSVAYLHCCLNPILYAFTGSKFRSHFRQIVVDLWCFGKKYILSARSGNSASKPSDGSGRFSPFSARSLDRRQIQAL